MKTNEWYENITNIFSLAVTQQYFGAFQKPHPVLHGKGFELITALVKLKNDL